MNEPTIAQKGPYNITVEKGKKYAWCSCGLSIKQPFCDGAHKIGEMRPIVFTAEKDEEIWFCGCKRTSSEPNCDGTHNNL